MRVTDLQVDGFGVWKGLTVESLSDDITIFHGQNEAGKTTLMQFVRTMLFGFSEARRDKYTPPVYGGLAGGSMDVMSPRGSFEIQRHMDPGRLLDAEGDLALTDTNTGTVHGRAQLSDLMSDIDESIFNNVFAIGLREIQELGALNSTDAAEHLYKLTSGLDRVSLIDVMNDLRARRDNIYAKDPADESRLAELTRKRNELMREIDELKTKGKRWSRIAAQTNDVSSQLEELNSQLKELERESRLVEIATQISKRWVNRRTLTDQINSFGKLPERRDIDVEKLDDLNERVTQQRERIKQVRDQRKAVKKEAMDLPINRRLWRERATVEAITAHQPWVESLERTASRLQNEIDGIENSLVGEVDGLGMQLKIRAKDVHDLGNRGLSSLKSVAKKLLDQQERLKRIKQEGEKAGLELGQNEERLSGSLTDTSTMGSMEDISRHVNRLRRRIEL
ncbi:MAG: AAA family ATPase [Planctomycetota bacterium]